MVITLDRITTGLALWLSLTLTLLVQQSSSEQCSCTDIQPSQIFTCQEQKNWGKCLRKWIVEGGFCHQTCGICKCVDDCACYDLPPNFEYTCEQQRFFNKCEEPWMIQGNFCAYSCNRCSCTQPTETVYQPPPQIMPPPFSPPNAPPPQMPPPPPISSPPLLSPPPNPPPPYNPPPSPDPQLQNPASPSPETLDTRNADLGEQVGKQMQVLSVQANVGEGLHEGIPEEEDILQVECTAPLSQQLQRQPELSIFAGLLFASDLEDKIKDGACTLFAPNDFALNEFLSMVDLNLVEFVVAVQAMRAYMEYHIIPQLYSTQQWKQRQTIIPTMLQNTPPLTITNNASGLFVTSPASTAMVVKPDIDTCQCQVHVIDTVLSPIPFATNFSPLQLPPGVTYKKGDDIVSIPFERGLIPKSATNCEKKSVQDVLERMGSLAEPILEFLEVSNVELISQEFTVFVPQVLAFEDLANQLGFDEWEDLMDLGEQVSREIVEMHLLSEEFVEQDLGLNISMTALNGIDLNSVVSDNSVVLEAPGSAAEIVKFDVGSSCNIAVHEISNVLLPYPGGIEQLKERISSFQKSTRTLPIFIPSPFNQQLSIQINNQSNNNDFQDDEKVLSPQPVTSSQQLDIKLNPVATQSLASPWDSLFPNFPEEGQQNQNCSPVFQVLQGREDLALMGDAFADAGMGHLLNSSSSIPLTIFALDGNALRSLLFTFEDFPNFQEFSRNQTRQQSLLGYHIVKGEWNLTQLSQNNTGLVTLVNQLVHSRNQSLHLNTSSIFDRQGDRKIVSISGQGDWQASQAIIMEPDIRACNAYIHVISNGLSPINPFPNEQQTSNQGKSDVGIFRAALAQNEQNFPSKPTLANVAAQHQQQKCIPVVDLLNDTREASWFAILLQETGLAQQLRSRFQDLGNQIQNKEKIQKITIFVPFNRAFAQLEDRVGFGISKLVQNTQMAKELLQYHITEGWTDTVSVLNSGPVLLSSWFMDQQILLTTSNFTNFQQQEDLNQMIQLENFENQMNKFEFEQMEEEGRMKVVDGLGEEIEIIGKNWYACDAIVHVIDGVLLPNISK